MTYCQLADCHRKNHGKWCKPKPVCSVEGCTSTNRITRGWCSKHYQRWKVHGDVNVPMEDRLPNVGSCTVEGCEEPMRKRSWCNGHYTNWRSTGEEPKAFKFKWNEWAGCLTCGSEQQLQGSRQFCSRKCQQLHSRTGGLITKTATCNRCQSVFDLFEVREGRSNKKRVDSLTCSDCKRLSHLTKFVVPLRKRDGDECALCHEPIDFTLTHPDPGYRTVDHIVPWAMGGNEELSNLQLSHSRCNSQRRALGVDEFKEVFL